MLLKFISVIFTLLSVFAVCLSRPESSYNLFGNRTITALLNTAVGLGTYAVITTLLAGFVPIFNQITLSTGPYDIQDALFIGFLSGAIFIPLRFPGLFVKHLNFAVLKPAPMLLMSAAVIALIAAIQFYRIQSQNFQLNQSAKLQLTIDSVENEKQHQSSTQIDRSENADAGNAAAFSGTDRQSQIERFSMLGMKIGEVAECQRCWKRTWSGNDRMPFYRRAIFYREELSGRLGFMTDDGTINGKILMYGRSFQGDHLSERDLLGILEKEFGPDYVEVSFEDYYWLPKSKRESYRGCTFQPSDVYLGRATIRNMTTFKTMLHLPKKITTDCGVIAGVSTYGDKPILVVFDSTYFYLEEKKRIEEEEILNEVNRQNAINSIKFE